MNLILRNNLRFIACHTALISFLAFSTFSPLADAKSKPDLQGLVEEKPVFDTSLSVAPFQLGIEHKETIRNLRKNKTILRSKEALDVLRGEAKAFKLETSEHLDYLKAQSAKTDKALQAKLDEQPTTLQGRTDKNGTALRSGLDNNGKALQAKMDAERKALLGRVDQNGKPLQAGLDKTGLSMQAKTEIGRTPPRSALNTVERIRPTFKFDLRKLTADVAPDLAYKMDDELEQSHIKSAGEALRQQRAMELQLKPRSPKVEIPPVRPNVKIDLGLAQAFESELARAKEVARQAAERLRIALLPGNLPGPKMPAVPGPTTVPKLVLPPGTGSKDSAVKEAERSMDNALAKINRNSPSTSELDQKLEGGKTKSKIAIASVEPGVDAILTNARYVPQKNVPAVPSTALQLNSNETLLWDEWHARFADLAKGLILAKVSAAKNTTGANTVEIKVFRSHRLEVKISKPSNESFDRATLDAYGSLSGNSHLEFPIKSQRDSITFLVDNEHRGAGVPSHVQSRSGVGDKEVIQH